MEGLRENHMAGLFNPYPVLICFSIITLVGCAAAPPAAPPAARIKGVEGVFRAGDIIDTHRGEKIDFDTLMDRLASHDLIFVGEIHSNAEHHLIQAQVLQAMMTCCGPVDVAMEFFRTPQQEALDRYVSGKTTESEFLREADWAESWGFPYHLYRPLLRLARESGSRVLAINVPRELVRKVARVGLNGLTSEERARLPLTIDLTDEAHRSYVREAYLMHGRMGIPNFQFFYEAQCVYEEVMAHNIAEHFENAGRNHPPLVAFTGNGHIAYRFGVPDRVLERTPVSLATVMPYVLHETAAVPSEIADFIWLTPASGPRGIPSPPAAEASEGSPQEEGHARK